MFFNVKSIFYSKILIPLLFFLFFSSNLISSAFSSYPDDYSSKFGASFILGVKDHAQDIGIHWARFPMDVNETNYNTQELITINDNNLLNNLQTVGVVGLGIINPRKKTTLMTSDQFASAVTTLVERYDGDGVNDAPGLTHPVKVWELINEYSSTISSPIGQPLTQQDYINFMQKGVQAIQNACPDCLIALDPFDRNDVTALLQVVPASAFDIISYHTYSPLDKPGYQGDSSYVLNFNNFLQEIGLSGKDIWVTEYAMYNNPTFKGPPESGSVTASQTDNARWYIQTTAWGFGTGMFDKTIYTEIVTPNEATTGSALDWMSLVDKNSNKRQIYYAMKKLIATIDKFTSAQQLSLGNNIYAFKFAMQNKNVYILWTKEDTASQNSIVLTGISGTSVSGFSAVPDTSGVFQTLSYNVTNNSVTIPALTNTPVVLEETTSSSTNQSCEINFTVDSGIRINKASNPHAYVAPDNTIYLAYEKRSSTNSTGPNPSKVAVSNDGGLAFTTITGNLDNHKYINSVLMPDGKTYRRYMCSSQGVTSESSTNNVNFTPDAGKRYNLNASDNNTCGVFSAHTDNNGGVVFLYIGDMSGVNNIRMAYSQPGDNGMNFSFVSDNVCGDSGYGGKGTYVDTNSLKLPDGRVRLVTMRQDPSVPFPPAAKNGYIYTFISNNGRDFTLEEGARISPYDFTKIDVWSLNDPKLVRLPSGLYRIYVAAMVKNTDGSYDWAIVSATSADCSQCSYSINPSTTSVSSSAGNGSIAVTASNTSCAWTATSNDTWIQITSGSSGAGSGIVNYTISSNTTGSSRTGSITAAGETFTVIQNASASSNVLVACDMNGDKKDDFILADASGNIRYTLTSLTGWINIQGALLGKYLACGDLNNDGNDDIIGLKTDGSIWYTLNKGGNWNNITGALSRIFIADMNGDGKNDILGLTDSGNIYISYDLVSWNDISGILTDIQPGNFNISRQGYEFAGLNSSGYIYYTTDLYNWTNIPGSLAKLFSGDINSDGKSDLIGLNSSNEIFYTTNLQAWTNIQGGLVYITTGDLNGDGKNDIVGLNSANNIYYTTNLSTWTNIPGQLTNLLTGDFNGDGKADVTGFGSDDMIYYTTDLNLWQSIAVIN